MIAVTEKSRCAVRALGELARRSADGPVPILEIAEATGMQVHFLEQLFASMRRAGILQSQRGVKGGYAFHRDPADVTVLDVVETVDGALTPPQLRAGVDATHELWEDVRLAVAGVLGAVSLAEVIAREERLRDAPMFHI